MPTQLAIFSTLIDWLGMGLVSALFILLFARLGWLPTAVVMAVSDRQLGQMQEEDPYE